jgi:hypothetical protein
VAGEGSSENLDQRDSQAASRDVWEVYYLQGARAGYAHTRQTRTTRDGQEGIDIVIANKLALRRFGQEATQEVQLFSRETLDGRLLNFRGETRIGPTPILVEGKVDGDRLLLESRTGGKPVHSSLPWSTEIGGVLAVERSLLAQPMSPGQTRVVELLMPMLNEALVVKNQLKAIGYERTELLDGPRELLRIESEVKLPGGGSIASILWTDRHGETLKTRLEALEMEAFRAPREVALNQSGGVDLDLGYDTIVPVAKPIPDPHHKRMIRYRVHLQRGDPSAVFVSDPTQQVRAVDSHTAEVTVRAIRPGGGSQPSDGQPRGFTEADIQPNSLIQSDDPQVRTLAIEAIGSEQDPSRKAALLERFVHDRIRAKNFSQTLATAADVARTLEGDCTEHAMLLAALARAVHIPARIAIGLVYVSSQQGFGYHMWNDLWIDGQWTPFDATLGQGGIGAGHLKLGQSNLAEGSAMSCFLPVANVIGQLSIDVLEVN